MCVTTGKAAITGTMAYTYATLDTRDPRTLHVSGYQNRAISQVDGGNCMLLHFPGNELRLVKGPEDTRHMMDDITRGLPKLAPEPTLRGVSRAAGAVAKYGDYYVVLSEHPSQMLDALQQVPEDFRPQPSTQLYELLGWYEEKFPDYAFVLACFRGAVSPRHPIVVEYIPHNDDVLFVPGLDGHDGNVPEVGASMNRSFRVAFGAEGHPQPNVVNYNDDIAGRYWAPWDVTGFVDNRADGPNQDYIVALETINEGFIGRELVDDLIS